MERHFENCVEIFYCADSADWECIGPFSSSLTRLSAKPFLWQNHFHINSFALSLALKQRFGTTRKLPMILRHSRFSVNGVNGERFLIPKTCFEAA